MNTKYSTCWIISTQLRKVSTKYPLGFCVFSLRCARQGKPTYLICLWTLGPLGLENSHYPSCPKGLLPSESARLPTHLCGSRSVKDTGVVCCAQIPLSSYECSTYERKDQGAVCVPTYGINYCCSYCPAGEHHKNVTIK